MEGLLTISVVLMRSVIDKEHGSIEGADTVTSTYAVTHERGNPLSAFKLELEFKEGRKWGQKASFEVTEKDAGEERSL